MFAIFEFTRRKFLCTFYKIIDKRFLNSNDCVYQNEERIEEILMISNSNSMNRLTKARYSQGKQTRTWIRSKSCFKDSNRISTISRGIRVNDNSSIGTQKTNNENWHLSVDLWIATIYEDVYVSAWNLVYSGVFLCN